MDMTLKRDLPNNLGKFEQEYGLMDLVYPSFTRAFGFQLAALSAADAVDGLGALLDAATGINMEVEVEGGRGGGEWFGGTRTWAIGNETCLLAEEKAMEGESEDQKEHKWHVQNFWIAYDACDE
jgi:cell division control protein 45